MNNEAKTFWKNAYDAELARGLPTVACAKEATLAVMEATAAGFLDDDPMPDSNDMKPQERNTNHPVTPEEQRAYDVASLACWLLDKRVDLDLPSHRVIGVREAPRFEFESVLGRLGLARKPTANDAPPHTHESLRAAFEEQRSLSIGGRPIPGVIMEWSTKSRARGTVELSFRGVAEFGQTSEIHTLKATDEGQGVSGVEASAIGDVLKVPPHWHVKLSATATPSTGAAVFPDDVIEFVHNGEPRHADIGCSAREERGLIVFDVVLPFPLPMGSEVRFRWPRAGVANVATVVSII